MKKSWVLSQEAFDAMLAWLDSDREVAGGKYETIRVRLIKIFVCRGCANAEELADETINRVVSKVQEIITNWQGDPALYFYKVAQNIYREWWRQVIRQVDVPIDEPAAIPIVVNEVEYDCLEQCLRKLDDNERSLVVDYYQSQGRAKIDQHKKMAAEMGIAVNALRIRAHRIRRQLKTCVVDCLEAQPVN
jgi:DNA-directed RNA polymerase specialized sigma24 family protein